MKPAFPKPEQITAPCLLDFYKCFHAVAYKEGVEEVLINFTARFGKHTNIPNSKGTYMWAGLQGALNTMVDVWNDFFAADKADAVATYKRVNEGGLGVLCDTSKLEALHDLGYLPLEFRALTEGVEVPYGVAAFTCRNTHPDFYFLPNMLETFLSSEIWPVQTSLTTATEYMRTVKEFAAKDGTPEYLIPFLGHDFSMRGMMGATINGGAALSGIGHMMSGFVGSDTLPAALKAEKDYGAVLGMSSICSTIGSVPATEHSVQCSFNNDDLAYFRHCMAVSPEGILSLVSDGYDFWKLITELLPQLKDEIMARNGKIVIRPDSGDPVEVICGKKIREFGDIQEFVDSVDDEMSDDCGQGYCCPDTYEDVVVIAGEVRRVKCRIEIISAKQDRGDRLYWVEGVKVVSNEASEFTTEQKGLIEVLWEQFGGEVTEQGFKILDSHIGAIYGDSITLERQREIYSRLHAKGFAIANIVLGIGSYTYQYVTRDTHGSAVKATNMIINGVDTPIAKEVATDANKRSAKGRLKVVCEDGVMVQYAEQTIEQVEALDNEHKLVWRDGEWFRTQTLDEVRETVADYL